MEKKPTPDKLNIDFWKGHPHHPARIIVDKLLSTRSEEIVSVLDKYLWYEIVCSELGRFLVNLVYLRAEQNFDGEITVTFKKNEVTGKEIRKRA